MATFRLTFQESEGGFIYFSADDEKHAEEFFEQLMSGDLYDFELPDYSKSVKTGESEYYSLEKVCD